MKGGLVSLTTSTDILNILATNGTNITVDQLGASSSGGYLFKLTFDKPIEDFISVYPGKPVFVSYTQEILLKFVQINDTNTYRPNQHYNDKEIANKSTFEKEVQIQSLVYQNSLNFWFEPICPNIINSGFFSRTSSPAYNLFMSNSKLRDIINTIFRETNITKIGYIFMELLAGSKPVSHAFPDWKLRPNIPTTQLNQIQKTLLKNYVYQLIRLYNLGYTHGDTHLENAMFVDNYDYLENYRVYLIDFGRADKNTGIPDMRNIYTFSQQQNGLNYWSYQQVETYVNNIVQTRDRTRFKNKLTAWYSTQREIVNTSREHFIQKLYDEGALKKFKGLSGTHSDLTFTNTDFIFKANDIQMLSITARDLNLRMNLSNICCFNSPEGYVGINERYKMYNQEVITFVRQNNFTTYCDEEFLKYDSPDGIFLWVIGIGAGSTKPKIYFIHVDSCFEFVIKHATLIQHYGISSIYAAGEMVKIGFKLTFNFLSGTYMIAPLKDPELRDRMELNIKNLNNALIPFVRYKLNRNPDIQYNITLSPECLAHDDIRSQTSIMDNAHCCEFESYNNYQYRYFKKTNKYFTKNGRESVFTFCSDSECPDCRRPSTGGGKLTDLSMQNDIQNGMKQLITINNLYMNEIDTELNNKFTTISDINLQNNLQILNEFARICCMNSYNNCLNTINLYGSNIQEKIILVSDYTIEVSTVSDIKNTSKIDSTTNKSLQTIDIPVSISDIKNTSKIGSTTNKSLQTIDIPVSESSQEILTGGLIRKNKKKTLRKKKNKKTKSRNKTKCRFKRRMFYN
jgi:hypothetical protein